MLVAKKIFNRSQDASPTSAKNVIVSSAENRSFASSGAVRSGFNPEWLELNIAHGGWKTVTASLRFLQLNVVQIVI